MCLAIKPASSVPLRRSMGRSNRHYLAHPRCHAVRDKKAEADPRAARRPDVRSCRDSELKLHYSHVIGIRLIPSSHTLNDADSENPPTRPSSRRVRVPGTLCEVSMGIICKQGQNGNRISAIGRWKSA